MLKNKIIVKKIRNIFILLMAIIIMIGVYRNIRNSRAENVIQIEMEVADKSKLLENQTIIVDATETKDGNYLVELPTSVNENIVTKYYTVDGAEVTMNDEDSDKTLRLTETEVANKKIEVETDYDTEEVITVDQQKELFYNKEIKKAADENGNGEGDVIATGYMPLDAKAEINEIDLATLTEVKIPNEKQTMKKAYEVSIYQETKNDDNVETEKTEEIDNNNETENLETERIEYDASKYSETIILKTKNAEQNEIPAIYSLTENVATEVTQTMFDGEYIYAEFRKTSEKVKYILATEPKEDAQEGNQNTDSESQNEGQQTSNDSNIMLTAASSGTLKSTSRENSATAGFLGNTNIQRQNIEQIQFTNSPGFPTPKSSYSATNNTGSGHSSSATTWKDLSGSNNGTVYNATWGTDYLQFTRSKNNYVNLKKMDFNNNAVTLDATFSVDSIPTDDAMFIVGNAQDGGVAINVHQGYIQFCVWFKEYNNGSGGYLDTRSLEMIKTNTKYHVTGVYDGKKSTLYINGKIAAQNTYSGTIGNATNNTSMMLGCDPNGENTNSYPYETLDGKIYEVSIYDKALTDSQVKKIINKWDVSVAGDGSIQAWYEGDVGTAPKAQAKHTYNAQKNTSSGHSSSTTTWKDLRGSSNGTVIGGTWNSDYLKLDGTDDVVNLGNISLANNKITLDATIMMNSIPSGRSADIISNIGGNPDANNETTGVCLNLNDGYPQLAVWTKEKNGYTDIRATTRITAGQKVHITGMYNGRTAYLYVNGRLAAMHYFDGTMVDPNHKKMAIGARPLNNGGYRAYSDVNVYEVNIYNQDLAQSTVEEIANRTYGSDLDTTTTTTSSIVKVYIGSTGTIYANSNSSYLFANIGSASGCTATSTMNNLNLLNTSNVTNMNGMFYSFGSNAMTKLDLGTNFDTSNVTDMEGMFNDCGENSMTSLNLGSKFNTSKVTTMFQMFTSCGEKALTSLNLGDYFDTSNVTNMMSMFLRCGTEKLTSLDLGSKFDTSKVTNMSQMFADCGEKSLKTLKLGSNFNTSNVTDMSKMFQDCGAELTSLDLGDKFDTSNVTNMRSMFAWFGRNALTELRLGSKFTKIASDSDKFADYLGKSSSTNDACKIYVPSEIYKDKHTFKLGAGSSSTIAYARGILVGPDSTKPTWDSNFATESQGYSSTNKTYQFVLVGQDETNLNNSSQLSTSNMTVKVAGRAVTSSNLVFGTASVTKDSSGNIVKKKFPITIKNYTGGKIDISINAGALVDTAGNTSVAKTYSVTPVTDSTAPVWATSVSNGTFSSSGHTYSLNLVGTDETELNSSSSVLSTSNVTVKVKGTTVSSSNLTFGNATTTSTSGKVTKKTFPLTIKNYWGGKIDISINAGALVDAVGNQSAAKTYSISAPSGSDSTAPKWADNISGGTYSSTAHTYALNLTGTDETALNDNSSALSTSYSSSNITVKVNGSTVSSSNLTIGTATKTKNSSGYVTGKVFPLTIKNYTGGKITITINSGALKDMAGNTSASKIYEFTPNTDVTAPKWADDISGGEYSSTNSTYSLSFIGTDETGLNDASSVLSTSNVTVKVNGSTVAKSNLTFGTATKTTNSSGNITQKKFPLTINSFKGGTVSITINAEALVDTAGNKSEQKTYSFTIDGTAPKWADNVDGGTYSGSAKTYSFNLIGTDETSLNSASSTLNSNNTTIKVNGGTASVTFGSASTTTNSSGKVIQKTFPITIKSYIGGRIDISINAEALVDSAGNKSVAKTYSFTPTIDTTAPTWEEKIKDGTYSYANETYSLNLVGSDETALNASSSVLNSNNTTVKVNGKQVATSNLAFGSTSTSKNSSGYVINKTFPLTIKSFTGGDVEITISAGALVDTSENSSAQKVYTFTVDGTLPEWSSSISGGTYDSNSGTYSLKLIGTDETGLNNDSSVLNSSNVTVTMGGKTASVTFGTATLNDKTKTFPLTINSFTGGDITISISEGALVDTSGNKSIAKSYSFSVDITPPTWNDKVSDKSFDKINDIYSFNITGTDETSLNNTLSVLNSSNTTITVDGKDVTSDLKIGGGTISSNQKTKVFPISISNFTGGNVKIVIKAGALVDNGIDGGNTSAYKEYEFYADITDPVWGDATGSYNPDDQSYTITVTGTDNVELNTNSSAITTSNSTLTVGGSTVSPIITRTASTSTSVTYQIKISNHTGGAISLRINEGALIDAQNNTSAEKNYSFAAVDATKPTWKNSIDSAQYDKQTGIYTFNLIGTDNIKLNNSSSSLAGKLTIKTGSTVVSASDLTIGSGTLSSDGKTKTFPITVRNFKGGNVTISIGSKALYDETGNWSDAKTYTFFQDVTPPLWTDTVQSALYNHSTQAYTFNLVGSDETALSDDNSTLNATITVGESPANVTYGTASFDSSTQTKTFPVTINNYTGGVIKITIAEGSLKDTANNTSNAKVYEFTPDITKPVWDYQNLAYDADSKTYSVELVGTDESALNTTVSSLITSGSSKNVTVTCGSTTVTPTLEKVTTESKKIVYRLTINNYPGGAVTISIGANALIDASSNKSDAKEIKLPEKDITKPTLKVQNPSYSDTDGEYTFEVVATDEKAIDATKSSLSPSGSAQNITVKCGNVIVTPIVTIKSTTEKEIIYTVTIQKYPSGVVNVSIAEGAIYDTTGNKNTAATFTLPASDIAKPTWDDELQFNYDEGNQKITITITGRDETSLNNTKSLLDFSNTIVTVDGTTLDEESNRVTFEEATLSADKMTKTFPITISGYTGGKIQIAIDSGALEDNSGKKSDAKEYEIIDIIKPEWKMEGAGTYNKTAKSYTLKFKGTDEAELASASLTASDLTVTVNGTAVTPTIEAIDSESDIKTKVFTVTIANFTGGEIKTTIKQGTLTDRGNNKSDEATFSVTPDITIPVWTYRSAAYTQYQGNEVSIEFTGTDNVQLVSSKLKLDTEGFIVKEGSTVIDSSRLTLNKEEYGDGKGGIKYVLKMTGYSNGSITITLPDGLLTDVSGNTSNATTLTVGVIPPLDDDTPPAVSNIVVKQDKGMEAVVIDFDITDEWFDFKEAVESGEITITKTTTPLWGQSTTSDITSSCNIKITKETKLSNGKHYQVKISNINTSTGMGGGSNTFTITLKADSVHDLAGNGNISTQLFNGAINFTLSSSDPAFLKYSVELDESNKTLDVVIIANTANSFFEHFKQTGQWGWRNNI